MLPPFNSAIIALLALTSPVTATANPSSVPVIATEDPKVEFDIRLEMAKGDVKKMWRLHSYCEINGLKREDRKLLRMIIKLDSEHEGARAALGHVYYDDQWFPSQKKYEAYMRKNESAIAKAKGWVRYKDQWIDPADRAKLEAGMVRDESGKWMTPQEMKYKKEGWVQFDLEWISPEDQAKVKAGQFRCNGEWLDLEAANAYHSDLENFWTIESRNKKFIYRGTLDRARAIEALDLAEEILPHMDRLFGRAPTKPLNFVVLNSGEQYSLFATGSDVTPVSEVRGFSSFYGAYFAELYMDGEYEHMGAGVGYWDANAANGDLFGKLFLRHAAGLSFVEGLDPSPKAMEDFEDSDRFNVVEFFNEKKLPNWLRYGAASYVERYRPATELGADLNSLRKWSVSNVERRGALDSAETIIAMLLTPDDPDTADKLISEAGLLVAFILDGKHPEVTKAHAAFRQAFAASKPFKTELIALQEALKAANSALVAFAHS